MKILICGGHLTPALSFIEQLPNTEEILYVGRKYALEGDSSYSLEYQTIQKRNIPFVEIETGRLQRKFTSHTIPALLKLPKGFMQACKIIQEYKPDIILGFGSYVSLPLCVMGWILHIPVVIHEQTLEAGLANKILAKIATKICVSWQSSLSFFPKNKTVLTGNPIVQTVQQEAKKYSISTMPTIVIIGGSLGSHAINILIEQIVPTLLEKYTIIHQTGDAKQYNDFARLTKLKDTLASSLQKKYILTKFIDPSEIVQTLKKADIVISRAGINTVTTLLALKRISILIPLPFSQKNEQLKNALFLKQAGLSEVAIQSSLTPEKLLNQIVELEKNKKKYHLTEQTFLLPENATDRILALLHYAQNTTPQQKTI